MMNKSLMPEAHLMSSGVAWSANSVAGLSFAQDGGLESSTEDCGRSCAPAAKPAAGRKVSGKPPGGGIQVTAEKVLRSFNTWAFKREQPSDPQLMLRVIADAIAGQKPIPFVLYWGKGPRCDVGAPDIQCLDFLGAMSSRLRAAYPPGAVLTLIFTDTHAELNGHAKQDIHRYFAAVKAVATQRGIETCSLGSLVKAAGHLATVAPIEETVSSETLSLLLASAQKWYHGSGTAQEGALAYLRMNLIEQRVVERAFPRSIFVTFNGSDLRGLFPHQLPIFYMYSLRRGFGVKPWFLPSEPASANCAHQGSPSSPDAS
jgi:L-tyrosine isonitrile synthase